MKLKKRLTNWLVVATGVMPIAFSHADYRINRFGDSAGYQREGFNAPLAENQYYKSSHAFHCRVHEDPNCYAKWNGQTYIESVIFNNGENLPSPPNIMPPAQPPQPDYSDGYLDYNSNYYTQTVASEENATPVGKVFEKGDYVYSKTPNNNAYDGLSLEKVVIRAKAVKHKNVFTALFGTAATVINLESSFAREGFMKVEVDGERLAPSNFEDLKGEIKDGVPYSVAFKPSGAPNCASTIDITQLKGKSHIYKIEFHWRVPANAYRGIFSRWYPDFNFDFEGDNLRQPISEIINLKYRFLKDNVAMTSKTLMLNHIIPLQNVISDLQEKQDECVNDPPACFKSEAENLLLVYIDHLEAIKEYSNRKGRSQIKDLKKTIKKLKFIQY